MPIVVPHQPGELKTLAVKRKIDMQNPIEVDQLGKQQAY